MNRQKNSKTFIFFLILSLLILLADYFGLLKPLKGFFEEKLVIPIRLRFTSKPLSPISLNPSEYCSNKDLEIAGLKTQIASLKEENTSLKKLLGAPLPPDLKYLPVKVIGGNEDEILIDKGEKDGVKKEMAAVAEGIFLGKVDELSQKIAKVKLLSSSESKEVVKIIGKESLNQVGKGLLIGKGEGKMEIRQILAEEEVLEGDLAVISSGGTDLPIGRVTSVTYKKGEVFKTCQVKREINIRTLGTVFLIVGKI